MAVDKLVDSTQLDADLTSVANAIRTKGGTSADLAFPAGFVSAVEAIPTGGGGYSIDDLATRAEPSGTITIPNATSIGNGAFQKSNVENVVALEATTVSAYAFNSCSKLKKVKLPKVTSLGSGNMYTVQNSTIEQFAAPKLTGVLPSNFAQAAAKLAVVDAGKCTTIQTRCLANCTLLATLILRHSTAITRLSGLDGIALSTPFTSGGTGGTIYIPEVLYNHLGDGTSLDYKAATNWSTVDGYGTITWAKLEGSQYESEDWLQI